MLFKFQWQIEIFCLEELDPDPGFFSIPPVRSIVREYIQICILLWKIHMNEYLIANTNFRIWILNCRGREINRKNNTRCNNIERRTSTECRYMKWTKKMARRKWLPCVKCHKFLIIENSHRQPKLHIFNCYQ